MELNKQINEPVDIIIPTFNNFDQLASMISSVAQYRLIYPVHFIVVNNGEPEMSDHPFFKNDIITVLTPKKNLGWEGALKLGLKHSKSEFVMFANDDIYIPEVSKFWLSRMLQPFHDKNVAAVGPCTNVAMGQQNIFSYRDAHSSNSVYMVPYLIGFCMLVRRSALDAVGGVDDTLPGGDDLDLSIRFRKAGFVLAFDCRTFVWHYGFSTGNRVFGDHTRPNGWNSQEMTEKTNMALIKKHGLKEWYNCLYTRVIDVSDYTDYEGNVVQEFIKGEKVVELGVGAVKTVPRAVGVDMIAKGQPIPSLMGAPASVADIVADVTKKMPIKDSEFDCLIARHILEHTQDTVETLKEWSRIVKKGGRLIIVVPNEEDGSTIPMNPEHKHSFTPSSLTSLVQLLGMKVLETRKNYNLISFLLVAEKL